MDATALTPAIFSLIGVVLGTAGSLIGVYAAQHAAREQARIQHAMTMRNERKEVLLEYLEAVQDCWFFLAHRRSGYPMISKVGEMISGDAVHVEQTERNRALLYRQQKLNLVTSKLVRNAAVELSEKMDQALDHPEVVEAGLSQFLNATFERFVAAARQDLGIHEQ